MIRRLALAVLLAVLSGAVSAGLASAGPQWKLDGEALIGEETVIGGAPELELDFVGLTTTCEAVYLMKIVNEGGTGEGLISYLPIFDCETDSPVCTVATSKVVELPWGLHLTSAGANNYAVIEGVSITIVYAGEECVLAEVEAEIEGSAGGRYDNETETIGFDQASFSATGTELDVFGQEVDWDAVFSAEAFGPHLGEALTVS